MNEVEDKGSHIELELNYKWNYVQNDSACYMSDTHTELNRQYTSHLHINRYLTGDCFSTHVTLGHFRGAPHTHCVSTGEKGNDLVLFIIVFFEADYTVWFLNGLSRGGSCGNR